MNISAVSASASTAPSGDAVAISVMKKSQDIEKTTANQLLEALPDPMSPLGQKINVTA